MWAALLDRVSREAGQAREISERASRYMRLRAYRAEAARLEVHGGSLAASGSQGTAKGLIRRDQACGGAGHPPRANFIALAALAACMSAGAALILCAGCAAGAGNAGAGARAHREAWYAGQLAVAIGGATEARMPNGTRCDVLTPASAIEVEFAAKWCESVGQSLNYASQSGRRGAVALILERGGDERFLARLRGVIAWHGLPIDVLVLKPCGADGIEIQFPEGLRPDLTFLNPDLPVRYR